MTVFTDHEMDQLDRAEARRVRDYEWHYTKPTKRLERTPAEVLGDLADKRAAQRFSAEPVMLTGWGSL